MSSYLVSIGFKQLVSDQCVYTKGSGDSQLIVCTWVDDIILASARGNEAARVEFDAALRREFEMSPWTSGEASWVLNMKVVRDWNAGTLRISQPGAIEKLAAQFKREGRGSLWISTLSSQNRTPQVLYQRPRGTTSLQWEHFCTCH